VSSQLAKRQENLAFRVLSRNFQITDNAVPVNLRRDQFKGCGIARDSQLYDFLLDPVPDR